MHKTLFRIKKKTNNNIERNNNIILNVEIN